MKWKSFSNQGFEDLRILKAALWKVASFCFIMLSEWVSVYLKWQMEVSVCNRIRSMNKMQTSYTENKRNDG